MAKGIARIVAVGLLAGALAGCGTGGPPPPEPGQAAAPPTKGYYKVGRPYQVKGVWYTPAVDYAYDETGIASWYGPGFHGKQTANGETYDQYDLTAAHPTLPMPSLVRVTNLENGRTLDLRVNDRGPFKHGRIIDVSKRGAELLGFLGQGIAKVRVQVLANESKQLAALARQGQIATGPGGQPIEIDEGPSAPVETVSAQELPSVVAQPQGGPTHAQPARSTAGPPVSPASAPQQADRGYPSPSGEVGRVPVRSSALYVQAGAFADQANALQLAQRLAAYGDPAISQVDVRGQRFWRVRLGPLSDVEAADRMLASLIGGGFPQSRVVVE